MNNRTFLTVSGAILAGYIAVLAKGAWMVPPSGDLPNVAAYLGFNVALAYVLVAAWTVVAAVCVALFSRHRELPEVLVKPAPQLLSPVRMWLERIVVFGAVCVLYWPFGLARLAPHVEDTYILNALWRMSCGQAPYTDFEWVYGPLMLMPVAAWVQKIGFSMPTYFAFYMAVQAAFYALVIAILQNNMQHTLRRYLAFVLLAIVTADFLYGLNWIGWRYFPAALSILVLAARPQAARNAVAAGIITGLHIAYSYEYGLAALLAGTAVVALGLFEPGRDRAILSAAIYVAASASAWSLSVYIMLGEEFGTYLSATKTVADAASSGGLGQFAFFWTAHSLALFGLLSLTVAAGGLALGRLGRVRPTVGDRQLLGAIAFALITLRVGVQRADFLHIMAPFVPLILVVLIAPTRRLFHVPPIQQRVAVTAIAIAAAAHLVAYAPVARYTARAALAGLWQEMSGRPTVGSVAARHDTIYGDRAFIEPDRKALAARLAAPDLAGAPVMFYRTTWGLPIWAGVCPEGYASYVILYTPDEIEPMSEVLDRPGLLVVIREAEWRDVQNPETTAKPELARLSGLGRFAQIVGSPHFSQTAIENRFIEGLPWRERAGRILISEFQEIDRVMGYVLLQRP